MSRLNQLRERQVEVDAEMRAILDQAEKENEGVLTDEAKVQYDALDAEYDANSAAIVELQARADKAVARKAELETVQPRKTAPADPNASVVVGKDRIEDDPQCGFKSLGEMAAEVHGYGNGAITPERATHKGLKFLAATGMEQGSGAGGGFLVPPQYSQTIWDGMRAADYALLPKTDTYTVTGESLTFPAVAETSRVAGSRWGGVRGYWIAEAAQMTASKPTFRELKVEPKELAVLSYVTDKLLRNVPALGQFLTRAATSEINFLISDAIINGDGTGKPKGIMATGPKVSVTKEGAQAAATIVYANIVKMYARMHANWRSGAEWYINQDCEPQLLSMTLTGGTASTPAYMPPGGLSGLPYGTLFGRPVIPIEHCQTLGTTGDIIFANLKAYCSGTQGGVRSDMSIHLKFDYNETAFRFLFAVDGQPWLASALTPFKGSNTLSPFVVLATRS